ncbi:MAG: hypothetical protein ACK4N5_21805, partial [Myxococcales bacterium]
GYSQEVLHVYLAEDLAPAAQQLDEDELVELVPTPLRGVAANMVMPVRTSIQRGESILRKGDVVSPAHLQILAVVGIYPPRVTWVGLGGLLLLIGLLLALTGLQLWAFRSRRGVRGA